MIKYFSSIFNSRWFELHFVFIFKINFEKVRNSVSSFDRKDFFSFEPKSWIKIDPFMLDQMQKQNHATGECFYACYSLAFQQHHSTSDQTGYGGLPQLHFYGQSDIKGLFQNSLNSFTAKMLNNSYQSVFQHSSIIHPLKSPTLKHFKFASEQSKVHSIGKHSKLELFHLQRSFFGTNMRQFWV